MWAGTGVQERLDRHLGSTINDTPVLYDPIESNVIATIVLLVATVALPAVLTAEGVAVDKQLLEFRQLTQLGGQVACDAMRRGAVRCGAWAALVDWFQ